MPSKISEKDEAFRKQAGVSAHKYHGCPKLGCMHVWDEDDKTSECPVCGGPRYDAKGVPLEEVIYFPLKDRLEALLSVPAYYDACMWENYRQKPKSGVVSGI